MRRNGFINPSRRVLNTTTIFTLQQKYICAYEYFADSTTDKTALIKYAKIVNIEEKVRDYMDVLN